MTIRDHQPRQKKRSSLSDERETPAALFHRLNERYKFTIDAAASRRNHKLPTFWTKKCDGLKQSWKGHRIWINPPYSDIGSWVDKACLFEADLAVLLVPAWTDRQWFHSALNVSSLTPKLVATLEIQFLKGRLRFGKPGSKTPDGPAPFPCMLMFFERVAK